MSPVFVVCCVGSSVRDTLIACSDEALCVCVCVCVTEKLKKMRRSGSMLDYCATGKELPNSALMRDRPSLSLELCTCYGLAHC